MQRSSRLGSTSTEEPDEVTVVGPVRPYRGGIALHTDLLIDRMRNQGLNVKVESWAQQYPRFLYQGFRPRRSDRVHQPSVSFRLSWWNPFSWISAGFRNRRRKVVLIGVTPFQYPIFLCVLLFSGALISRRSVLIAHNVTPHETTRLDRVMTTFFFRCVVVVLTHSRPEYEKARSLKANSRLATLPYHGPTWNSEVPHFKQTNQILFLGYVREYKGLDLLIEALSKVDLATSLIVAGEFWQPISRFQELCKTHQLTERVDFRPGFVEDIELEKLLDEVDLLVLPYRSATATQLPALARTRRTPSIVTPVGELANCVEHMKNGVVASHVTSDAIAQAISSVYHSDLLKSLSENCLPPDESSEWGLYMQVLLEE